MSRWHDDVLQIEPMLLKNTLLLSDPHRGDTIARHSSGKISLYGGRMANAWRKEHQASKDQESPWEICFQVGALP